jgi:Mg-chelatase subunit ChlD
MPELALLALPAWFAYRKWGRAPGVTGWVRLVVLSLLLLALTGPQIRLGGRGLDVIVVADRSRSMPEDAPRHVLELIENLERARASGDRVGIVSFGGEPQVERLLSHEQRLGEFTKEVAADGSDLAGALETALNLVDPDRPARLLVLSDGEANGADPAAAARRAREAGVPIDFRAFERPRRGDVSVAELELPESVVPLEPFQFNVWVQSDRIVPAKLEVFREGRLLATREVELPAGRTPYVFRDLLDVPGFYSYEAKLTVAGDPLPENDRGAGLVRVDAGPRVLLLTNDGRPGNLGEALRAARIPFETAVAAEHPLTQDALDPFRAVLIENVPAKSFGRRKMERLAQFVEDLGGGLLLTGGERSFGTGGYFKSPLDDVLPVSMEMREEHRKTRIALAVALDRSGSMAAPVAGGKTKMDLADLGTAECVKLLSPGDSVAVIAVDSSPHVVQALVPVVDPQAIARKALGIQSMGGGIFVYEALVAAGRELAKADQVTKHVILFSDAADSEEPGDYKKLLEKFEQSGITVSVIGLGTESDPDADLLKDVAKRGRGNIMFTADAAELPRLFTEDTMSVARSSFVTADAKTQPDGIPGKLLAEARLMGDLQAGAFPSSGGYNLSYAKPDATVAVVSQDEYQAPWSAFWFRGTGRVAAVTLEVDGKHTGAFGTWDEYADFLVTHVRWLLGRPQAEDVFVTLERQGQDAVVTVELDPARKTTDRARPPALIVVPPGEEQVARLEPDFTWVDADTLQARFRLDRPGSFRTLVKTTDGKLVRGPAVTLPYSPEHAPRTDLPAGREVLVGLAELTGGTERAELLEILKDPPRSARTNSLVPWLAIAALTLLVVEIGGRRLSLWERAAYAAETALDGPATASGTSWLPQWRVRLRRKSPAVASAAPTRTAAPAPQPTPAAAPPVDIYAQAKQRAQRRMK